MTDDAPDRAAHRAWLVSLATLPAGGVAVDLGCGRGEDLRLLAARFPDADARFVGLDASVDLAYSHNLLECLPDGRALALEIARVLKPGGAWWSRSRARTAELSHGTVDGTERGARARDGRTMHRRGRGRRLALRRHISANPQLAQAGVRPYAPARVGSA